VLRACAHTHKHSLTLSHSLEVYNQIKCGLLFVLCFCKSTMDCLGFCTNTKHNGLSRILHKIQSTMDCLGFCTNTKHNGLSRILHKYKILDSPTCFCKNREQTVDHILFGCKLSEPERDSLKAAVLWSENWPVSKNKLITKFNKTLKKFTNNISFDRL